MITRPRPAIVPPFLKPGEPVAVVAPSGVVDPRRLERGIAYLKSKGHPALVSPHVLDRHGYLAGDDEARAADLNDLIAVDTPRAWFFARGGYGLTRILDRLDLEGLRRRPRLLLGYSDMTALAMALQRSGPYLVHYGPTVSELGEPEAFDEGSLWRALYGARGRLDLAFRQADVVRAGRGSGLVMGGCLSLLVSLLGTPYDPDYRDAILFWEEIGEEPYRIDRMLTQLRNAGKLDRLRGMLVGSLTGCEAAAGKPSLAIREILLELAQVATFPIVWNVRAGHMPRKITLLLGSPASLNTYRKEMTYRVPRAHALTGR
ncbi:MAG: S66 peptidase family protein [Candidatus Polarisedimenticolia bacterium]